MFRCKKGEYGYISKRKYQQLFLAILMGLIGLLIYGLGYILNGYKQNNICLVLGILMVLPGAKFLTTYILLFPYHTPDRVLFDESSMVTQKGGILLSDLVITSTERAMNLDFLYVGNECVYGLIGKTKMKTKDIQDYIAKGVRNWGTGYTVKIVDSKENFQKTILAVKEKEINSDEEERVLAYLYSLIV
ncbi:MAG: hypothetical protein ACERKN_15905 [Velocimicrobium sp.]